MKFIIKNQEELSKKLTLNLKATSSNNIIEAFKNLKLKIKNNTIEITSYNNESCVISTLEISNDNIEECEFLVDANAFKNVIDKLIEFSASEISASLDLEKERIYLSYKGIKFSLKIFKNTNDFKGAPNLDTYSTYKTAVFNKNILRRALLNTKKCTIKDQARPILEAINIVIDNNKADVVAIDGYKLALNTIECESCDSFRTSLSASGSVSILTDILQNGYDFVELNSNGVYTMVENDDHTVFLKEMQGQLIDYNKLSRRRDDSIKIKVNKKSLQTAITGTKIGNKANAPVRLTINPNDSKIIFDIVKTTIHSDVVDSCEIPINVEIENSSNEKLDIFFNSLYFLDLLSSIYTDNCNLIIQSSREPFFLENENDDKSTYLLLPVRVSQ